MRPKSCSAMLSKACCNKFGMPVPPSLTTATSPVRKLSSLWTDLGIVCLQLENF